MFIIIKMIKHTGIAIVVFLLSLYTSAQAPASYYSSASGLSGIALHDTLHNIIKNNISFPYTSANTDTWDILKESDSAPGHPDSVVMVYAGWLRSSAAEYPQWSREHVWAKSHGDFGTTIGTGTDLHNLKPSDVSVNSARNNKDFDEGGNQYIDGDGPTQCYASTYSWEPRDEVKGDIARIIFYMDVRYDGDNGEVDLQVVDYVNTSPNNEPYHGKLSTLLQWHIDDPVDSFEMHRNDVIYSYQNNRNPFIDHPEYVGYIWQGGSPVISIQQQIPLVQGWSIISANVEVANPSMVNIFSSVASSVLLVKDNGGSVFWPAYGLNMIGDYDTGQGYFCKMSNYELLLLEGVAVNLAVNPIYLQQGWNTIAYLPQIPATTYAILSSILSQILIMKDGQGNVFWPAFALDLIGIMSPGKGYQIKMVSYQEFYFPTL